MDEDGGPGHTPPFYRCDASGFYKHELDGDGNIRYRVNFPDELKDGYADLLRYHHR